MLKTIRKWIKCVPGCDPAHQTDEEPFFKEPKPIRKRFIQRYLRFIRSRKPTYTTAPTAASTTYLQSKDIELTTFSYKITTSSAEITPFMRFRNERQILKITEDFCEAGSRSIPAYLEVLTLGYKPRTSGPVKRMPSLFDVTETSGFEHELMIQQKFKMAYLKLKLGC